MYDSDDILNGARAIRPYLTELLGGNSSMVEQDLVSLLSQAQEGRKVDNVILDLLARHEATREWIAKFLEHKRPPDIVKLYSPPPGDITAIPPDKYACPQGDYIWYRRSVASTIPVCPTHFVKLVLVDEAL